MQEMVDKLITELKDVVSHPQCQSLIEWTIVKYKWDIFCNVMGDIALVVFVFIFWWKIGRHVLNRYQNDN